MIEDLFKDYIDDYIICPTTGKKLHPVSMIPLEDHVSFSNRTLDGEFRIQCQGFDGPCDSLSAEIRHRGTAYVDDKQNWVTQCDSCYEQERAHWDDMWMEYYAGRL